MKKQPNILWIQTDEHRADSLGCYGSSWAKTPNIDSLAARGTLFRKAYCQSPICSPSRASQMTARYPQEVNALSNLGASKEGYIPKGTITFPEIFRNAGYHTYNIGKWHMPQHPVWESAERLTVIKKYADYTTINDDYDENDLGVVRRPGAAPLILAGTYPVVHPTPSEVITDQAIDYLKERDPNKPFFLRVSHNWPHTPVLPPKPYDQLYKASDIPIVYYEREVEMDRSQRDQKISGWERMGELTKEQYEKVWTDYMGLCAYVDYEIGRLLNEINNLGLKDDTIIFFSSDHGRNLGEYGAGEKCTFDDVSWRVPFIWSWPGYVPEGKIDDGLCEMLDTGRTLLRLAGLEKEIPSVFRGRDLFNDAAPEAVFGQIGWPVFPNRLMDENMLKFYLGNQEHYPRYNTSLRIAIRTNQYSMDVEWMKDGKRSSREELDGNLFDLKKDPLERENLFNKASFTDTIDNLLSQIDKTYSKWDAPPESFELSQNVKV